MAAINRTQTSGAAAGAIGEDTILRGIAPLPVIRTWNVTQLRLQRDRKLRGGEGAPVGGTAAAEYGAGAVAQGLTLTASGNSAFPGEGGLDGMASPIGPESILGGTGGAGRLAGSANNGTLSGGADVLVVSAGARGPWRRARRHRRHEAR